ncbi:MAG TPA: hypothetical protein DEP72_04205 [Clostridiales bacterium]|nr:MAG: hypothetical protein A2Y18_04915 [Clostridiales bacterium GWD2_32_19]HCC07343.1 hypothetical protein [Clostridiales bacterium]
MGIVKDDDLIGSENLTDYFAEGPNEKNIQIEDPVDVEILSKPITDEPLEKSKSNSDISDDWSSLLADFISARKGLGITQRDLAKLSGIEQSAIARMEANKKCGPPRLDTFGRLIEAMGLRVEVVVEEPIENDK